MSAASEHLLRPCLNCGSPDVGKFCPDCGQRSHTPVHSIGHFAGEAFEALTHMDSRLWRTLWSLVARPGFLTREYIGGRQVRYLPPVQLYLVMSVLFFVLARGLGGEGPVVLEVGVADASKRSDPSRAEAYCTQLGYEGPFAEQIRPRLIAGCQGAALDGGEALLAAFLANVPRALFLLLPVIALVMKLMYWRPRHYYVEHLLLLIHNHSAAFVVLALIMVVGAIPGIGFLQYAVLAAAALYLPWYLYKSLRRVYGQSRRWTLGKFATLSLAYVVVALAVIGMTALFSVATT
jgi:Protein of unknown function (DUF3667)